LNIGIFVRMLETESAATGETPLLEQALDAGRKLFESEAAYLENNIDYSVIPIKKLVQVQLGSALLALQHHKG
jgi:hypothetical protein